MGKRGTKPTPTETLKIRGSWRVKKRENEPAPVSGRPDCPDWLLGEARAEWDRQVEDLDARRLIAKTYRAALAMFCEAWGEYVDAVKWIQERGAAGLVSITDKGNEVQHPMVGVKNKAFERANKLGQQFGFSPSSQVGLKAGDADKSKDPFEAFLQRKKG